MAMKLNPIWDSCHFPVVELMLFSDPVEVDKEIHI